MLGGIIGGALKAIGLEELAPIASLAVNVMSGNWAGAAMDVVGLVGQFSGNEFLKNISQNNPLGAFMGGGGAGGFDLGSILQGGKVGSWIGALGGLFGGTQAGNVLGGAEKIMGMFETVQGFIGDQQSVTDRIAMANTTGLFARS